MDDDYAALGGGRGIYEDFLVMARTCRRGRAGRGAKGEGKPEGNGEGVSGALGPSGPRHRR